MSASEPTTAPAEKAPVVQIAELFAQLAAERAQLEAARAQVALLERERDTLRDERNALRQAYEQLRLEVELLRRRLFVAKAERVDTAQLELEFRDKLAALDALCKKLDEPGPVADGASPAQGLAPSAPPARPKPTGRRDLAKTELPTERVEIPDPHWEALCAAGKAERIGFEESSKLAHQRGGLRRLVVARVKYRQAGDVPETTTLHTTPKPPELFERSLAAPSLLAHIATDKYCDGLPLARQEDRFSRDGARIDRGTMCRWMEDAGATLGATVVAAARKEAMETAFCIATDATGVAVQPERAPGRRQPCRRGHYFVQIADRSHIFFEYTPQETGAAVGAMFKGFRGPFVQADAKSIFDVLFRPPEDPPDEGDADRAPASEVGCWSHARRKFWEAACAHDATAREGLVRIGRLFALEDKWKDRPYREKKALRQEFARPHLDAFFDWAEVQYAAVRDQRGLLRTALGYVLRQKDALRRYLEDGRLVLDNNRSERELRRIAVGRKAWLFVGSDDHAQSAGHLFSLIASARLHRLDPESYLRDLFRVLAHWPRDRYLELCPRYWQKTRARLDARELATEIGPLTVPPPLPTTPEQQ